MDIRWMLEEAACDCHRTDVVPMDARFDPAFVINEARKVPPTSVVSSTFMDAYSASLRTAIINGVDVRRRPAAAIPSRHRRRSSCCRCVALRRPPVLLLPPSLLAPTVLARAFVLRCFCLRRLSHRPGSCCHRSWC